jgi:hypothetical protein
MKITILKDHRIIKTASAVSREYITKCNPDASGSDPLATKRESYAIEVFLATASVVSCIDQLYFSIDMLSGYRVSNAPKKMNRHDYIVYGIENYYLRLTSVYDRCLRLTNDIFQIGLPERQCNNESIVKNAHIKGSAVAKALTKIDKFTGPFRFHRNTVAHQKTYTEKNLSKLGSYYYLAEEDPEFEKYIYAFKKKTDDYVSEKKKGFNDNVVNLERLVKIFFDSGVSIFEARLKEYA